MDKGDFPEQENGPWTFPYLIYESFLLGEKGLLNIFLSSKIPVPTYWYIFYSDYANVRRPLSISRSTC